jgi:hypothetical protein
METVLLRRRLDLVFLMPPAAFKVWMYHYSLEGGKMMSWPSVPTIEKVCGLNRKTVFAARKWLVANGWLVKVGEKQSKDGGLPVPVYRVQRGLIPENGTELVPKNGTKGKSRKTVLTPVPENGTNSTSQKTGHEQAAVVRPEQAAGEQTAGELVNELVSESKASDPANQETFSGVLPAKQEQPHMTDKATLVYNILYPVGCPGEKFREVCETLNDIAEYAYTLEYLQWNRIHKTGKMFIRTADQLKAAMATGYGVNDMVAHNENLAKCPICKPKVKMVDGKPLPPYRQESGRRTILVASCLTCGANHDEGTPCQLEGTIFGAPMPPVCDLHREELLKATRMNDLSAGQRVKEVMSLTRDCRDCKSVKEKK